MQVVGYSGHCPCPGFNITGFTELCAYFESSTYLSMSLMGIIAQMIRSRLEYKRKTQGNIIGGDGKKFSGSLADKTGLSKVCKCLRHDNYSVHINSAAIYM